MGRLIKAGAFMPVNFQAFEPEIPCGPAPEEVAATHIEKARTEAEMIIRTARSEAEDLLAEARRVGHEDGYRDGMAEAASSVQSLMGRLEDDIASVSAETQAFFDSIEPQLLKLCSDTVEKVIRHEIKTNPMVITRVIKSCLRRIKGSHEVRIRVNPSEVAAVRAQRDELLSMAEGVNAINIVDDRRISAGGCVIETAIGDFDATLETQLERIEQKLTETLENDSNTTCPEPGEVPQRDQSDGYGTG